MIITIDGPAGSGKSTAARNLAAALGIAYLDTGATYRAVTLAALRGGVDMEDAAALARIAAGVKIELIPNTGGVCVLMDGEDVTGEIRSAEVSDNIHSVAGCSAVRDVLVELQRSIGRQLSDFVAEGRDQGSVVFPGADIKFFLVASQKVRAQRRCDEMLAAGHHTDYEQVLASIIQRDRRDEGRAVAPLIKPEGAVEIDTSANTMAQTCACLLAAVKDRR
jgi:cytidylate kinase